MFVESEQLVSLLVVDDDPLFRRGLQTLLGFYANDQGWQLSVVGEAASVMETVHWVQQAQPQLVLLDLELGDEDGLTVLWQLKKGHFGGRVLVLSAHREDERIFQVMQAGASGYVFKDYLGRDLYAAIAAVMQDEIYLSPEAATGFFRMFHFYAGHSLRGSHDFHLKQREQEVLYWLVQGASNEIIAKQLCITVATVKAHLTSIFEKLEVTSRTQAIIKALKLGLVST